MNKHYILTTTIAVILLTAARTPVLADGSDSEESIRRTEMVKAVEKVVPTVVNISAERLVRVSDPFESFFRDFFELPPERYRRENTPVGSGVIIASPGLILTNLHVIRRASGIEVRLNDKTSYPARVAAFDQVNDLALLMLEPDSENNSEYNLPPINFAWPDDLYLAEPVAAVGNPFGLESSVTTGIISALNRHWRSGEMHFDDIVQTDSAINPGNSGGPLINLEGELIGINLAIRAGAEGIGFAIPVRRLEKVLAEWLRPRYFSTGTIGFSPLNHLDAENNWRLIAGDVEEDGPAAESGLREGDVIKAINGRTVRRALEAGRELWHLEPGDDIELTLDSGELITFVIPSMSDRQLIDQRLRLQTQELSTALKEALRLPREVQGLIVSDVYEHNDFRDRIGRGDIILSFDSRHISGKEELAEALRNKRAGDPIELRILASRRHRGQHTLQPRSLRVLLR